MNVIDSVLIVSNTNTTLGIISDLLQSVPFSRIVTTQNAAEGRRFLLESDFDLIIIDTPLSDEFGSDFALEAAHKTMAGIILIVDQEKLYDINANVEDSGVFTLPKPASPLFFYQACKLLFASKSRLSKMQKQVQDLMTKLEETKIVSRAKCLLIEHLHITENQAHKKIEKEAMDTRQSRLVCAQNIIRQWQQ